MRLFAYDFLSVVLVLYLVATGLHTDQVGMLPTLPLATFVLLRFPISQMDVPTRQPYTMAVIAPDERSAASGVTSIARSLGAAASPALSGALMAGAATFSAPFFIAGGLKIVYDLLLYRSF